TIQDPLEKFIQESIYDLLHLPLHLLSDDKVEKITSYMKEDQELAGCINHNKTFQRFISDISEQLVNYHLMKKYLFDDFATIMKLVVAYAILNIPVDETDKFEIGIINLEVTRYNPKMPYVCMPYIWMWITTSIKEFKAGQFWDVMIDQKSHILGVYYIYQGIPLLDHKFQLPTVEKYYLELAHRYPDIMQNKHLLLGTVKSSNTTAGQPQTLSKAIVKREYKKVKNEFEFMEKSFKSERPIKHWIFLSASMDLRQEIVWNL
ncbi:1613_t:CDS:2, partial [Funneliformis geosporum]